MKIPKLDGLTNEIIKRKIVLDKWKWLRYAAAVACVMFVCNTAIQLIISFKGNQATDIYRRGSCMVVSDIMDIPGEGHGKILAENLELETAFGASIELYFDEDGKAENFTDWYSLIISAGYSDYKMTMYCMFNDTKSLEEWKVDTVFTEEATQMVEMNGISVLVARCNVTIDYIFNYYAIFEYQNVIYDIRVQSNNVDSIFTVLDSILSGVQ